MDCAKPKSQVHLSTHCCTLRLGLLFRYSSHLQSTTGSEDLDRLIVRKRHGRARQ